MKDINSVLINDISINISLGIILTVIHTCIPLLINIPQVFVDEFKLAGKMASTLKHRYHAVILQVLRTI